MFTAWPIKRARLKYSVWECNHGNDVMGLDLMSKSTYTVYLGFKLHIWSWCFEFWTFKNRYFCTTNIRSYHLFRFWPFCLDLEWVAQSYSGIITTGTTVNALHRCSEAGGFSFDSPQLAGAPPWSSLIRHLLCEKGTRHGRQECSTKCRCQPVPTSVLPKLRWTTGLILKHVIQTCLVCISLFRAQQRPLTLSGHTSPPGNVACWVQTENERGMSVWEERRQDLLKLENPWNESISFAKHKTFKNRLGHPSSFVVKGEPRVWIRPVLHVMSLCVISFHVTL